MGSIGVVVDTGFFGFDRLGRLSIVTLPSPGDCRLQEVVEGLRALPDDLGVVFHAESESLRVLGRNDARLAQAAQRALVQLLASLRGGDQPSCEVLHSGEEEKQDGELAPVGPGSAAVTHLLILPLRLPSAEAP